MDECVEQAAAQLKNDNFVVLDGFFGKDRATTFQQQLAAVREEGVLRLGVLAGGRSGNDLSYQHKKVRGDLVSGLTERG